MKKSRRYFVPASGRTELDPARLPATALIELCGQKQVLIENHGGVRAYDTTQVLITIRGGAVRVCGNALRICTMSRERLVIRGNIHSVSFRETGE